MSKEEFLKELRNLLSDLNEDERQEALDYYEEYFMEAGTDKEAEVIRELGSPNEVSYRIHEELADKSLARVEDIEKAESVSGDTKKQPMNFWKIGCIVLACIVLGPIVIPAVLGLLGGLFGLLLGAVGLIFGLAVAAVAVVVALAIVAVVLLVYGIIRLIVTPFAAAIMIGLALVALAAVILLGHGMVKFCVNVLPAIWEWTIDAVVSIYTWGKEKVGGLRHGRK